jgi:hypothetical protein
MRLRTRYRRASDNPTPARNITAPGPRAETKAERANSIHGMRIMCPRTLRTHNWTSDSVAPVGFATDRKRIRANSRMKVSPGKSRYRSDSGMPVTITPTKKVAATARTPRLMFIVVPTTMIAMIGQIASVIEAVQESESAASCGGGVSSAGGPETASAVPTPARAPSRPCISVDGTRDLAGDSLAGPSSLSTN